MNKIGLMDKIKYLLNNKVGESELSYSSYDTAWVAKIPSTELASAPMFPQCIKWLLKNQNTDGSWGSESNYIYLYDKLLSTLEVIITLKEWQNKNYGTYEIYIENGRQFINKNITHLDTKTYRSVGFETIFPVELHKAAVLNLETEETQYINELILLRKKKLEYINLNILLNKKSTLLYSLEGLDDQNLDWNKILKLQDKNGAFLCSPSSTAYVYLNTDNQNCLIYLTNILGKNSAVCVNTPIEVFEINWCLEILLKLNLHKIFDIEFNKHISYIEDNWNDRGMSWSTEFDLADLDDTSVSYYLLNKFKHKNIKDDIFSKFVDDNKINCFPGELDGSPSHILHLIQALNFSSKDDNLKNKAINIILDLTKNNNWRDKWHLSPYYIIQLLISCLGNYNYNYLQIYYKFIEETQNMDGGWGNITSNKEETAWACYALLIMNEISTLHNYNNILKKGVTYLTKNYFKNEKNNLWIAKFLFTPYTIVDILINSVIIKYLLIYGT